MKILILKNSLGPRYGGPAEDLENFLISDQITKLVVISHPLNRDSLRTSLYSEYSNGRLIRQIARRRFLPTKIGLIFDPLIFRLSRDFDYIIGFNVFTLFSSLAFQKSWKLRTLVSWSVDFTPPANRLRNVIEASLWFLVSRSLKLRIENSHAAEEARREFFHSLYSVPSQIIPIGISERDLIDSDFIHLKKRGSILFLGSINYRTGALKAFKALEELHERTGIEFVANFVGTGPDLDNLRNAVRNSKISKKIKIHGFLPEGPELQSLIFESSIALAPFENLTDSFTEFADPQKLKRYMGAACAVLMSDVPKVSASYASNKCALVIPDTASIAYWAEQIKILLSEDDARCDLQERARAFALENLNSALIRRAFDYITVSK